MSRYNLDWDEKKYQRYIKEGRGQGTGKDYKPWITVHDFPSDGFASRAPSWKTGRVHHFMSNNELRLFYLLDWSDSVFDIREQYPLEINDTVRISSDLGIKHPYNNKSGFFYVLTTDFMVTVKHNGKVINLARTVKPAAEIEKLRVLEKFEIERRYWLEKGISWKIVTDKDICKELAQNVDWIHQEYYLEPTKQLSVEDQQTICETLKVYLYENDCSINRVTSHLDKELNLERGTCLGLFKHLLATKQITMDMQQQINGGTSTRAINWPDYPSTGVKAL